MISRTCPNCNTIAQIEEEAIFCPYCGKPYPVSGETDKQNQSLSSVGQLPEASAGGPSYDVPWEKRDKYGFLGALYETWKLSCFSPREFYRRVSPTGSLWHPLLYALIVALLGFTFQLVYAQIFGQILDFSRWFPAEYGGFDSELSGLDAGFDAAANLGMILLFPFLATAWLFIWSGLVHLGLIVLGSKRHEFVATFRAMAYSEGPYFFEVVPIIGGIVAFIWQIVLMVIGIREVQGTTTGKALFAVLLPLAVLLSLCCCSLFWLFGLAAFVK